MTAPSKDRRQPSDLEFLGPGEAWPHTFLYPFLGFLLGVACPIGAFLVRFWLADPVLKAVWVRSELSYNLVFYVYMEVATVAAFVVFGYVLGARSDRQHAHNTELRRRIEVFHLRSITDGLTGAYTHGYLRETLTHEIERARRQGRPLSLLMFDIDDFKKLNDTHGHLFGDRVLVELVETLNFNIRREDILGRYGGEEFALIMPGADEPTAVRVAERIRCAVARRAIVDAQPARGGIGGTVHATISIGAASLAQSDDASGLIGRADAQLYHAKRTGKNRVSCAQETAA
ncbi:MAG: GGDEF domain-containing protein [Elusimicrobiota bacterium]|jgi:diguanylate cyclase (GGDEF)-like protein